jgi:site-specific recombinase XerD
MRSRIPVAAGCSVVGGSVFPIHKLSVLDPFYRNCGDPSSPVGARSKGWSYAGVTLDRRKVESQQSKVSKGRRYLRPDQAHQLVTAAAKRGHHGFRDKVLLRLVYRHGLRAAEACGLRWSQIDLDNRTIHVARVKGSKDSLHTLDRDEVRDLRALRKDSDSPYVFVTERGGPLSTATLVYIVREAGMEAGLDVDAHPHMLRHAAGYFLTNEGVDTRLIQEFLGHRDIRHTVRYTSLSPRRLAAVRVR